jgi:hypothetical protein
VPGAYRTRRHPTSRSSGHRVPELCDHSRSSAPGLLLLSRFSSLHDMPHLPPAHYETSKRISPSETKIKKQNKTIPDSNSNIAKSIKPMNGPLGFSYIQLITIMGRPNDTSSRMKFTKVIECYFFISFLLSRRKGEEKHSTFYSNQRGKNLIMK